MSTVSTVILKYLSAARPQLRLAGVTVIGLSFVLGILASPEFVMMTVAGACLSWLIENELSHLRRDQMG